MKKKNNGWEKNCNVSFYFLLFVDHHSRVQAHRFKCPRERYIIDKIHRQVPQPWDKRFNHSCKTMLLRYWPFPVLRVASFWVCYWEAYAKIHGRNARLCTSITSVNSFWGCSRVWYCLSSSPVSFLLLDHSIFPWVAESEHELSLITWWQPSVL